MESLISHFKKLPGFRSGVMWKRVVALIFYVVALVSLIFGITTFKILTFLLLVGFLSADSIVKKWAVKGVFKKVLIFVGINILVLFVGMIAAGVFYQHTELNKNKTEPEVVQNTEKPKEALAKEPVIKSEGNQTIGKEHYGFVDIPKSWMEFRDVDSKQNLIQYTEVESGSIITLMAYENPKNDAKTMASASWSGMEQQGAKGIQGATVQLGDHKSYQVYGTYPDNKMQVCWFFATDDGYVHYVSAEGSIDKIMDIVDMLQNTYRDNK